MAARGRSPGRSPQPGRQPGRSPGRKRGLDKSVKIALLRERDILAMGSREDIVEYMEGRYGQAELGPEEQLGLPVAELPSAGSEVSLADEDEFRELPSDGQAPSEGGTEVGSDCRVTNSGEVDIVVLDGRAVFQIPDWASGYADGALALRWRTYSSVADWLNNERPNFLCQPNPMNLAGHSIDFTQPVPVLQEGLHRILGLPCDKTTFSKHARKCGIRWPSLGFRRFPLDGLWSHDVQLAWMARAARDRQETRGYAPMSSPLGDPTLQPPRASAERKRLKSRASQAPRMGPIEFVQLLCVLTNCKWRDVLERHSGFIFYEE